MKKRSAKNSKIIKRLFNKMGMTYVELICALALLSLIVMMFTPMLLSSYETLYKAGERVEAIYDSKVEIEEGLASRSSVNIANIAVNFKMNATSLFDNMNVAGRKIVSHFQGELETVFHGARARVDLLSPSIVYDDKSWHDIILQTTGLDWKTGDVILFNGSGGNLSSMKDGLLPNQILIDIVKPDKTQSTSGGTTTDSQVYNVGDRVGIKPGSFEAKSDTKKISLQIDGVDFTTSPLKICVYYKNERGVLKTLSDYMYIKPAHIIFAGDTPGSDYYTSAGIEQIDKSLTETEDKDAVHKIEYQFNIEGRGMSLHNSKLLSSGPSGKDVIKVVEWIENDDEKGFDPYYVLAGTNGSVYRMYNLKNQTSSMQSLLGSKNAIDATNEYDYILETGEKIYPSFWSGDISDQYSFQTMNKASTYGDPNAGDNDTDCSAPNSKNGAVGTRYDQFDTKLRYSMVFNSYRTGYKYASQFSRKISYVLTEAGDKSFRIAGKKQYLTDFTGYNKRWEQEYYDYVTDTWFTANTTDERALYFGGSDKVISYATNAHTDMHLAFLRLNSYISFDPIQAVRDNTTVNIAQGSDTGGGTATMTDRLITGGEFWCPKSKEDDLRDIGWQDRVNYINTQYGCMANITSAAYLPGSSSSGEGQVIYFGNVSAYALLQQRSDTTEKNNKMYNTDSVYPSRATFYYISGSNDAGTTIYRNSSDVDESKSVQDSMRTAITNSSATDKHDRVDFYTGSKGNGTTYKLVDSDLEFTFGYCSRWRMTVGNVTYNGSTEETKSYEKFYTASHSGATYERKPGINAGSVNNLYYQVWFPGEFYNLTQTATLDEVTVAVGYTVSGSSYMSESHDVGSGYYGTALGSIYNDGVLAAYTATGQRVSNGLADKGKQNVIFQNLLYYKSPDFTNGTTHSRDSVRFTTVGLNAETKRTSDTSDTGTKEYYAYYGDSNGHVYRSLVATSNVTFVSGGEDEDKDKAEENVNLVSAIPDTKLADGVKASTAQNGLEEIKLTGMYAGITMNQLFKEITAIECHDDLVIITGNPQTVAAGNFFGAPFNGFVVGVKDANGNWEWKVHAMQAAAVPGGLLLDSTLDCAEIIGNYLYMSGYGNISNKGNECWIAGINLEVFRNLPNGQVVPFAGYSTSEKDTMGMWQNLGSTNRIYAIGGYAAS